MIPGMIGEKKLSEAKHHIEGKLDLDELDLTGAEAKAAYRVISKKRNE